MLWQRVMTAVLLLPAVLWVIVAGSDLVFSWCMVGVMGLTAREWGKMVSPALAAQWLLPVPVVAILAAISTFNSAFWAHALLLAALLLWSLALLWLWRGWQLHPAVKAIAGIIVLPAAGVALGKLHQLAEHGLFVLFVLLLVWSADVGAYFAGRALGRRKLAPAISPGKTREGAVGGVLLAAMVAIAQAHYFDPANWAAWLVAGLLVAVMSVIGDLVESLLKRQAGLKDSGHLLPGHGGLLDRLDSLLAAAPVFLAYGILTGLFTATA